MLSGLEGLGVRLEETVRAKGVRMVSVASSPTAVWVVPAEEDLMIAIHVERMARE